MGILDFIYGVLVLLGIMILVIGGLAMYFDTRNLEKENEELKKELEKARKKLLKKEYKKVSKVTKKEEK